MKTLVHFTADWCQPCKRMQPVIDKVVSEYTGSYIKINIEKDTELFDKYTSYFGSVMSVPTLWSIQNEELIDSHIGVASEEKIISMYA
jgi:thiol-disulfide isomerase/thioredoxin